MMEGEDRILKVVLPAHAQCDICINKSAIVNICKLFEKEKTRTHYILNGNILLSYLIKNMTWEVYIHPIFNQLHRHNIKHYFTLYFKKLVLKIYANLLFHQYHF